MKKTELNILIVEDEIIASQYLLNILESLGFINIFEATSFEEALEIIKKIKINLIFMDININGSIDGINSARLLNKEYFLPIIFTTAYTDTQTIIEATDTNIFGYLIKPFEKSQVESSLLITLKRMNISLKKASILEKTIINLGENQKYDLENKTFYINNKAINLTKKENDLLYVLCKNLNQNISYESLMKYVWKDKIISNSTIRDTISRLKRKVSTLDIENIINFGYILKN